MDQVEITQDSVQWRYHVWTQQWTCGFLTSRKFLDLLSNYQLFKDNSVVWCGNITERLKVKLTLCLLSTTPWRRIRGVEA